MATLGFELPKANVGFWLISTVKILTVNERYSLQAELPQSAMSGPSRCEFETLLGGAFGLTNLPFEVDRINGKAMPSDN
ncbi:MAG: hypothetical protein ACTH59_08485 [Pseudoalteromonas nigrifaciens]|uniref:hypothetical protein n=1 Tax=Pseudoalteromonas nigrifaciens TaxID=28109 RepID=UPI003F9B9B93